MQKDLSQVQKIGFLMLNNFSLIAFSNAVEVLRMANYLSGKEVYQWFIITPEGAPVLASSGLEFAQNAPRHKLRARQVRQQ